ncbi:MAG TPA: chemotaxis protein [Candidatus Krumholzibacteria bacterium]|nr:chemotaxis protein [Candidatus Krumholzibacteria bacterium]HPD72137.1 chemotaxis protein [Candidatus Krumholzibacteria bacterium]HRY40931.1 chemotaxis protein [Candidatus Krumholzibacteria bacterium]
MRDKEGILLESGTNEVEMLEFELDGQGFGVNVLKVQAIEQFDADKVTEIQLAHPAVIGTYNFRNGVITLIDLGRHLAVHDAGVQALPPTDAAAVERVLAAMPAAAVDPDQPAPAAAAGSEIETRIVLVMEFNETITGFLVDGVRRIHRVSWEAISPLSPYLAAVATKFTGSLSIAGHEVLVVDMERIVTEVLPRTCREFVATAPVSAELLQRRATVPVFVAEDSVTIREVVASELRRGGYSQLRTFDNGESCYQAIQDLAAHAHTEGRPLQSVLGAVITDIEMPRMDGMTLCRRAKADPDTRDLPVILFSSLINEQIARKCEAVGADGYISKPRFNELVAMVDRHALGQGR